MKITKEQVQQLLKELTIKFHNDIVDIASQCDEEIVVRGEHEGKFLAYYKNCKSADDLINFPIRLIVRQIELGKNIGKSNIFGR